jgi:predicted Zn-dependent protease
MNQRIMILVTFKISAVAGMCFLIFGCHKPELNQATNSIEVYPISIEEEVTATRTLLVQAIDKQGGLSEDSRAVSILKSISKKLIESSVLASMPDSFEIFLVKNPEINAYVVPGGNIIITEGLFRVLQTEDQLAGITSHMLAHAAAHHIRRFLFGGSINVETGVVEMPELSDAATWNTEVMELFDHPFNDAEEMTADSLAVTFMAAGNYNPEALQQAFFLIREIPVYPSSAPFLKIHPGASTGVRQDRIEETIKSISEPAAP